LHQSNSLICEENALTGTNNIHKKYLLKNLSESRLHAYWNVVSCKRSQVQTLQIEQTNKLALRCDTHGSRWCNALSEHTQLHAGVRRVICLMFTGLLPSLKSMSTDKLHSFIASCMRDSKRNLYLTSYGAEEHGECLTSGIRASCKF
jgi:hypothetical protein